MFFKNRLHLAGRPQMGARFIFTMHLHPDVAPRLVVGVIRPDTLFSDGWNAINVFVVLEGR
jgi:hypothetical protein